MSDAITIVIDGSPVAKGRPRVTRSGHAYTPAKTRAYEAHGRMAAQIAMDGSPPLSGPLAATVIASLPVPVSWSRTKRQQALDGLVRPVTRPDCDNYAKCALDLCNNIVWGDDSQVVDLAVRKVYATKPSLTVIVETLNG